MEKRVIKTSEILELLEIGKTRKEIAEMYNLSDSDLKRLFKHPTLKGRRSKKELDFIIEDDTTISNVNTSYSVGNESVYEDTNNVLESMLEEVEQEELIAPNFQ